MDRFEKSLVFIALALMVVFAALVVYAGIGLRIPLPTAHHEITPFSHGKIVSKGNNQFEAYYAARMWAFDPREMILPENSDVDFYVSAVDVMHGFEIPGTNVNLMALPGTVNVAKHRFDKNGEYNVICHEYCGLNHHNMTAHIRVLPLADYERIMRERSARITSEGEKLSVSKDCASCHTSDGAEGLAPTFKGMFGRTEKLTDGRSIIIDEAYIAESIKYPDKEIPLNYEKGSMPETQLTDEQIKLLVEYIKTLK